MKRPRGYHNPADATDEQKRQANDLIGGHLGIFTLTTSPNDPTVVWAYPVVLQAVMEGDAKAEEAARLARIEKSVGTFEHALLNLTQAARRLAGAQR